MPPLPASSSLLLLAIVRYILDYFLGVGKSALGKWRQEDHRFCVIGYIKTRATYEFIFRENMAP